MDKADHIITHWRTINSVNKPSIVKASIFRLYTTECRMEYKPKDITQTSTFSTTCFPKEQTFVEHDIVILSLDSY